VAFERMTFRTILRGKCSSRQISLIGLPREKYARRILAIAFTTSIPIATSQNPGGQCGPNATGFLFHERTQCRSSCPGRSYSHSVFTMVPFSWTKHFDSRSATLVIQRNRKKRRSRAISRRNGLIETSTLFHVDRRDEMTPPQSIISTVYRAVSIRTPRRMTSFALTARQARNRIVGAP